ncbi:helix-turn-helix domain-containing protein [Enterocloster lavalensis]|uniref:helix-turn-helix domain-containing protein n=1 Tax=Enterocloster lavalensis TaxID=460384 RepID=UPI0023F00BDE|nr:AraC family transcriptional regulator [Enterocloster lavalensis]
MDTHDIPSSYTLINEKAKGAITYLIAIYQNPDILALTGCFMPHSHDYIQFSFVTRGRVEFWVERKSYQISQGQGIFINADKIHMAKALEENSTYMNFTIQLKNFYVFFHEFDGHQYIDRFTANPGLTAIFLQDEVPWQNEILKILKEIYHLYVEEPFAYELKIVSDLILLWHTLILENRELIDDCPSEYDLEQKRIHDAIIYIEEHYQEKITLSDIAGHLHICKEEVCRLFKRKLNMSCFNYITDYRLMTAINLLSHTNRSIGEIAMDSGFDKFSHFTNCFKKKVGCSPTDYRKRVKAISGKAVGP